MKLWQKGDDINNAFERFTIGKDRELDLYLAPYDVHASQVHAEMLGKVGLISDSEANQLVDELDKIGLTIQNGDFQIDEGVEDVHSQIEFILTKNLGDVGKKIHTGRSRNDQVLTALKLFTRNKLEDIADRMISLFNLLISKSECYKDCLMPGYTHMQVAMPSSFGLWFGSYAESLVDDLVYLKAAHKIVNRSPLGSAAGYGSSFPLDRDYTSDQLGFSGPNINSIYAQATRGKMEKQVAYSIASLAGTISKLSSDICLYAGQDFGFFNLPVQFTTGSSIMPHKHNPDGFELLRAKCNQLQSLPVEMTLIMNNLQSGYHRDFQQLKERFIPSIISLIECLEMAVLMIGELEVEKDLINQTKYDLLFTVEEVNSLVKRGIPFRDAYEEVALKVKSEVFQPVRNIDHSHLGSIGELGNERIKSNFMNEFTYFNKRSN